MTENLPTKIQSARSRSGSLPEMVRPRFIQAIRRSASKPYSIVIPPQM